MTVIEIALLTLHGIFQLFVRVEKDSERLSSINIDVERLNVSMWRISDRALTVYANSQSKSRSNINSNSRLTAAVNLSRRIDSQRLIESIIRARGAIASTRMVW